MLVGPLICRGRPLAVALLSLFLLVPEASIGSSKGGEAKDLTISRISFEGSRRDLAGLRETIAIREGGRFSDDLLRQSVKLLERKEVFSAVGADYEVTPAGVEVRFNLNEIPRLSRIVVEGSRTIPARKIRRQIRVSAGQLLTPQRLQYVAKRVRQIYREEGFEQSRLETRLIRLDQGRAELLVSILEGLPLIVEEVRFSGSLGFPVHRLRKIVPIRDGARLRQLALKAAREGLLEFYRRRQYFEAQVVERWKTTREARGVLTFKINAGEPWCLRIEGNRALSDRSLLGLINLYRRPIITAGTWRELARRIEDAYRAEGFARASAEALLTRGKKKCVVLKVEEGPRVRVRNVVFVGNAHVSGESLRRAAMRLEARRLFSWGRRPIFVETRLGPATERIVSFYHARGYPDVSVHADTAYTSDGKAVDITVTVVEGPFYFIAKLDLTGEPDLTGVTWPGRVRVGLPYSGELGAEIRRSILGQLAERGYAEAKVRVDTRVEEAQGGKHPVSIRVTVTVGNVFRVGTITVAGNTFTRDHVVRREIDLQGGAVLNSKKLAAAEDSVYGLGLFRSAKVEVLPESVTRDPLARDILVSVTERPAGNLEYGFGYDTREGLRSFGELSHGNLWGTGRRVSLRADLGFDAASFSPNEYLANAGARFPRLMDSRFAVFGNVIPLRSARDVDEFSVERVTVLAGAERSWGKGFSTTWQVEFEDGRVFDVAPDARLSGRDEGGLRQVTINPITVLDTRDDAFVPTKGVFDSLRLRYGAPALGSDIHLLKINAQHTHYLGFGGGVVALYSLRLGYARLLGTGEGVPIRERFFLGGRTSVRGFSENEIGPHGEQGSPQGGDLLMNLNTELRFPVRGRLGGALFLDAGGLYLSRRAVTLQDFRRSAGLGVRYMTPVGPISLDYGFKLDRRGGEPIGQLHFAIGNVF